MSADCFIYPDWPAPAKVRAVTTTCKSPAPLDGGETCYQAFNLADHVGDAPERVEHNRRELQKSLSLPMQPRWLEQIHSDRVTELNGMDVHAPADAAYTRQAGEVCVVLTADCLPVLLCDREGSCVAAVHAGWRGLQQQIIAKTIAAMAVESGSLLAWLGPAIGPAAYEIDETVYQRFISEQAGYTVAFEPSRPGHWRMDLYAIARMQLKAAGVGSVYGSDFCTHSSADLFFSYRRDGQTGRMASLIWLHSD